MRCISCAVGFVGVFQNVTERSRGASLDLERYSVAAASPDGVRAWRVMFAQNDALSVATRRHLLHTLARRITAANPGNLCVELLTHALNINANMSSGIEFTGALAFFTDEIRWRSPVTLE
jgi:hypothetical protein